MLFAQVHVYAQNNIYNVKNYGAKGDGKTLDTKSIQAAIDKCYNNGGGIVFLPSGNYLSGCIVLKSNITFFIEPGAVLLGSSNKNDYKILVPSFQSLTKNLYVNRSILYAEKAENISIVGNGIIYGQGTDTNFSKTNPQNDRPFMVRFSECRNLVIKDVSMIESANWTCYLLGCKGVLIDGLKIKNSVRANRDGLDIDGCKDVTVSNCRISSMDDAIVLKSTGPAVTQNINIINCNVSSHASGIKMGTESTGGFENITVSNCVITNIPVYSGIALMIVDGGCMKNVVINNIVMDSVNVPFMIRLGNRARPYKKGLPTPPVGSIRNISINNVMVTNAGQTSHITGLNKKMPENITFSNITVQYNKQYEGKSMPYNRVPIKEKDYPSGQLYGKYLPASAFYFRNIKGLILTDINIRFLKKDTRVPFVFDRVDDMQLLNSRVKTLTKTPFLYLRNSQNCFVDNCSNQGRSSYLAVTEKGNCSNIFINPDKLAKSQKVMKSVPHLLDKD